MKRVWDNSNIIESYPGIVSPLTFSYAKFAYRKVYTQTARIFGVSESVIEENARYLDSMLGYINGHIYYNINSWLRLVSFLPGFGSNPRALQEMMGIREADQIKFEPVKVSFYLKVKTSFFFLFYYLGLSKKTEKWIERFDIHLKKHMTEIGRAKSANEAMEVFLNAEKTLLDNWYIPILNDFSVMITSTLLKGYLKKHPKASFRLEELRVGIVGNSESVMEIKKIAETARKKLKNKDSGLELKSLLEKDPALQIMIKEYIYSFGLRNGQNLKLETPGMDENNFESFINLLSDYVKEAEAPVATTEEVRGNNFAEKFLIKHYLDSVRRREKLRVKRSQSFALIRKIFLRIAEDFVKLGAIDDISDIFYLEKDEVFGTIEGKFTLKNLRGLVELRKKERDYYQKINTKDHFITEEIPSFDKASVEEKEIRITKELAGRANYPGTVTGEVVLMDGLNFDVDVRGKILICKYTDPNWVPLFGLIKGLVVERGGVLSHAAIVSRELKIPSIIGVENIFANLQDGQTITLDATNGKIEV